MRLIMEKVIVNNENIRGYLINSLANGRDDYLNILFLAPEQYRELISRLPDFYPNIDVTIDFYNAVEFFNINILKSDEDYKEKNYDFLEEISTYYLQGHYDNFIVGYSFYNKDKEEAIIITYHNGEKNEEKFILPKNVPSAIINLTIKKYDELKNTLQLKRVK